MEPDTLVYLTQNVKNILPEPFEWCAIAAGEVVIDYGEWQHYQYAISETRTHHVDAFYLAKYPLTVAQFEPFVMAGAYAKKTYWDDAGWNWIQRQKFSSPRYWHDEKWHIADNPVVHIAPCEAHAYLRWLSQEVNLVITLPTEQQWQRAAQGDDERNYPWGNEFKVAFANTFETKLDHTSSVMKYVDNISPYGVRDMSGNVWEMTSSRWNIDTPNTNSHYDAVVRGGSFSSYPHMAQCTSRRLAVGWDHSYGFRIAVTA